jgi:hypothetical protein
MYGVTFGDDGGLDEAATAALRERMRGGRRQRQTADWIGEDWCKPNPTANDAQRIGENISLDAQGVLHCCRCGTALSGSQGCVALTQRPLKAAGPWMALRYRGDGPNFVLEEISCPSCATLLSVREVRRDGGTKTSGEKLEHVRLAQAHRLYRSDRHGGRAYEFYRFAPDGVGLVGVTCNIDDWSQDYFDQALAQVTTAAAYLGSRGVHFVIHGGGPLVVARGKGYEEIIVKEIETAAKVPATTGVRAAMESLRHVGARRVAIASPYPERHNSALAAYLTAHDFEIALADGMDVPFKALQKRAARRHTCIRHQRDRTRRPMRCALSALPPVAGRTGRRHHRTGAQPAGNRVFARKFLRGVQNSRPQRPYPWPRPPPRFARGDKPVHVETVMRHMKRPTR